MRTKYVAGMLPRPDGSQEVGVVVFVEYVEHATIAELFFKQRDGVLGAGFFTANGGEIQAYGESVGLKIPSRESDAALIAQLHSTAHYVAGELPSGAMTVMGAVVFSPFVDHTHVAKVFSPETDSLISAGCVRVEDMAIEPYGKADSLSLSARPNDVAVLARAMGLHAQSR